MKGARLKMSKLNKVISLILAIMMVMTLIPLDNTAYASSINMDTTTAPLVRGVGTTNGWGLYGDPNGYRISVYYAAMKGYESDGKPHYAWGETDSNGKALSFPVGQSMDFRANGIPSNPSYWGIKNIYEYTTMGTTKFVNKSFKQGIDAYKYTLIANGSVETSKISKAEEEYINTFKALGDAYKEEGFPELANFLDGMGHLTSENIGIPAYVKGGNTVRDGSFIRGYFSNPFVLNMISYYTKPDGSSYGLWSADDFIYGRYKGGGVGTAYEHPQGQYKIYVEPLYYGMYDGLYTTMSWREMLVEDRQYKTNTTITNALLRAVDTANGMFLQTGEKTLKFPLDNYMGKLLDDGQKATLFNRTAAADGMSYVNGTVRPNYVDDKFASNYLGLGVLTSPSIASIKPTGKLVSSFVKIVGVNADGSLKYEQIGETTVEPAIINDSGYIENIEFVKDTKEGKAIINDIITSPKDLVPVDAKKVDWTGNLPKTDTDEIELSARDISHYWFGIVTANEVFEKEVKDKIVDC
jgi:hypothetical protein